MPSPKALLLNSEWLQQNMSQMLNISADNLTNLITAIQREHIVPERAPLPLLTVLTVFYSLIFVAGVLGNLITCIVISRNKIMHTATNFYLFNLAVSDLILLLSGMPQDLYNLWYPYSYPFDDVLCVMEGVLSETAANATVLTITAFTVERYIAICHPFRQHTMSKLSRAVKFIFAIWLTAFVLAMPQAMQFSVVASYGGTECTINNDFFAHVFAVSGFIFFGGPMTAICVLYVLIGVKLKRSRLLQTAPQRYYVVNRGISAQTRVIRMLIAVAVAFFLCWAPFHAQRLMAVYGSTSGIQSELFNNIFHILDYTSGVLYFLSTCINPLLYNIMSHKFREAFKVTLARQFFSGSKNQTQNHNYSALLRHGNGSLRLHHTTDSIRTTTTTTTINSGSGGGGGAVGSAGNSMLNGSRGTGTDSATSTLKGTHHCSTARNSQYRGRCMSMGSQSTLAANTPGPGHRMLQTQISQLSSVGDANSLMECDIGTGSGGGGGGNCRLKGMRRQRSRGADECISIDSTSQANVQLWRDDKKRNSNMHETELYSKPMGPHIMAATMVATQPIQPMNSIAELSIERPSRSRLKLSRIITRRHDDAFVVQSMPRVELMKPSTPHHYHKDRSSSKTLNSLAEKFKWRTKRKPANKHHISYCSNSNNTKGSYDTIEALDEANKPATALMKVVYSAAPPQHQVLESELALNHHSESSLGYRSPHAL
ncbi:neuropeptide CCHamide-2 receptor [Musca vetustissima]|uniref:neuropeptide CCHamide-2 receptor n=1 Tax=Musca vetustissima TaxID=27455 RepID=UPI002AB660D8|nr:neuropeptide CCHamide-2 receptor [Musca vetustissima]